MNHKKKYIEYAVEREKRYPGDFAWVTFYSPGYESGIKTEDYIRNISECTTSEIINLSGNNLYQNPILLVQAVSSIQNSAHTVDLSYNGLHNLSEENWQRLSAAFPASIIAVNFSNNHLGRLDFVKFKEVIKLMPPSIHDILLYNTSFNYPNDKFEEFLEAQGNRIKIGKMPKENLGFESKNTGYGFKNL